MVAAMGAHVILEAQPELKSLLSTAAGIQLVLTRGEALPYFDMHCPLLSLPLAFKTQLDTVPNSTPYLAASPELAAAWGARLGPRRGPRVGIVWAGSAGHRNDDNRSIGLASLLPLLPLGLTFVSLQKEVSARDRQLLETNPAILRFGEDLRDFADTAAVMSLLDLVIAVDTSVAHLAGAMNKHVWVCLPFAPEWRWLLEREDSPWYPTARLFRQPKRGDWESVIQRLCSELAQFQPS
jgi:hypothetical protein